MTPSAQAPQRDAAPLLRSDAPLQPDAKRRLVQPAVKARPRHGLYAGAWGVFGLMAGAYVFSVVLRHDGSSELASRTETDAFAKTQADVARLQQTVGLLETDVARIKIDQAQADDREKQLVQRVATVETRVERFSSQLAQPAGVPTAALPAAAANKVAAKALPPVVPAVQVPGAQVPGAQPAAPSGARIATGAIPQPVAAAPATGQRELAALRQSAPAADDAKEPAAAVLLARGPSLDALRLSWSLLNERHRGTLKPLEPRVVEVEAGSYQLLAGPLLNAAEAGKICAALNARGVACQTADFKGRAL